MKPDEDVMMYCNTFEEDYHRIRAINPIGTDDGFDSRTIEAVIQTSMLTNVIDEYWHFAYHKIGNWKSLSSTDL